MFTETFVAVSVKRLLQSGHGTTNLRRFVRRLQLAEVICDFLAVPVHGADKFAPDYAGAINHESLGPSEGAVESARLLGGISDGDNVEFVVFQKFMVGGVIVVNADAQDYDTLPAETVLHANEGGSFFNAGWAKTTPEIQDYDLSAKLA